MPEVAARYALPPAYAARGIRRYGFHGLSYSALVRNLPALTGAPLPAACSPATSATAPRSARSARGARSTRPWAIRRSRADDGHPRGNIDANAVLRLVEEDGLEATRRLLNHGRGFWASRASVPTCARFRPTAGRTAPSPWPTSATRPPGRRGASGRHGWLRRRGLHRRDRRERPPGPRRDPQHLNWLGVEIDAESNSRNAPRLHADTSRVEAWVVPADEEREIARDALALLDGG
jgi:acetate kinase